MTEAFNHSVKAVVDVFGEKCLRPPSVEHMTRLLSMNNKRKRPRMLTCIDCMHYRWKNSLTAWQGQYLVHVDGLTMIVEEVTSENLWI